MDESITRKHIALVLGILALLFLLGYGGYWIDRTVFYPQIRQNTIQNPDRSIANRKMFHDELSAILAADQNIQKQEQVITQFKSDNPKPWSDVAQQQYGDLETQLVGLQQIRQEDIATYNAASSNPDMGRDRDTWLPTSLDPTESLESEIALIISTNHS